MGTALKTETTWVFSPREIQRIKKKKKNPYYFFLNHWVLLSPLSTHPPTQTNTDLSHSQTPDRGFVPISLQTPLKLSSLMQELLHTTGVR